MRVKPRVGSTPAPGTKRFAKLNPSINSGLTLDEVEWVKIKK